VVEEEQRRSDDGDRGADKARTEAARGAGEGCNQDQQGCRIWNLDQVTVDRNRGQHCRCRQYRTGDCACIELHAISRSHREFKHLM